MTGSGMIVTSCAGCGAVAPYSTQGRTPSHGSCGAGAANHPASRGEAAYGTQRNSMHPSCRDVPSTMPALVSTVVIAGTLPTDEHARRGGDRERAFRVDALLHRALERVHHVRP